MKISIVIPAFNEERLIVDTLNCVRAAMDVFTQRGWASELIVCDNNSTDRTSELSRAAGATVVFESINQIARARNTGAAAATGDWLIFVDADSKPSRELFEEVAEQINTGYCLAGGATVQFDGPYSAGKLGVTIWNWISRFRKWFAGSFIFCEADSFRAVGGFSNEYFVGEEVDLSKRMNLRAKALGKKVVILHRHPLQTSDRKIHLYSTFEKIRFLKNSILHGRRTIKSREQCHPWYDGRR